MSVFNSLGSNYTRHTGAYKLLSRDKQARARLQAFLADRYQTPNISVTYKGREAIALALRSLNLPPGSFVAINGFTCFAVYQAVVAAGLKPHYLDIDDASLNFSPETLDQALATNSNIRVVMIQNTFGIPADIARIRQITEAHNTVLFEDLAHCVGMRYATGEEAGTVGQAVALSFSQDKVVDAVSGGAAVIRLDLQPVAPFLPASPRHRFATRLYPWMTLLIRPTIKYGVGRVFLKFLKATRLLPGPMSGEAGTAHQLPLWHSRAALKSFKILDQSVRHRQSIAAIYREALPADIQYKHEETAIYLRFPIKVSDPQQLIAYLKTADVYLADRWYDAPIAPRRSLQRTDYSDGLCPNAEAAASHILNLPTHVHVTEAKARMIAEKVNEWLNREERSASNG